MLVSMKSAFNNNSDRDKTIVKLYEKLYHDVEDLAYYVPTLLNCNDTKSRRGDAAQALAVVFQDLVLLKAGKDNVDLQRTIDGECPND